MALFEYRAADPAGKLVDGIMEAEAEHGVVARLHELGYIPLRISLPGDSTTRTIQIRFGHLLR